MEILFENEVATEQRRQFVLGEMTVNPCCGLCNYIKIPQKYIVSYNSRNKYLWDTFILILATYNSYSLLYENVFFPLKKKSQAKVVLNLIIDLIYIFDILLMFLTSVIDRRGKENFDPKLIAYRRVFSLKFYRELLSVLGTDIISHNNSYLKPFALLKVLRIFNLGTMIN